MKNKKYNSYNDIKNIISKSNKKVFTVNDFYKWIELFYNHDIILAGTKVVYNKDALKTFIGNDDKKIKNFKKDRENLFHILNENYNTYISNDAQLYLYSSLNQYFLKDFIKNNLEKENLFSKDEKNKIFKNFNIIRNIFSKYFLYSKEDPETEDEIILTYEEILHLGSIVLEDLFFLNNIIKEKYTDEEEFVIRRLLELFFIEKKYLTNMPSINLSTMTISSNLFLMDSLFYKELTEVLENLLDYKKDCNKEFIIKIFKKFLKRKDNVVGDLDDDNIIVKDLKSVEENFDNIIKKNKIKFDKKSFIENLKNKTTESNNSDEYIMGFNDNTTTAGTQNQSYTKSKKEEQEKLVEQEKKKKDLLIKSFKNKEKIRKNLKNKIIGQDNIIDNIIDNDLQKLFLGINKRPISMIFAGDSGLGKTELSKQLANELNHKPLLIHMGNYKHSHMDTALLGSPASYVGYGDQTQLEKYLIETQESGKIPVIVFDEIEKGHESIQNIYLEMLDEGKITFSNGKTYDLRQSVIIMTSNLGLKELKRDKIGIGSTNDNKIEHENIEFIIKKHIKDFFKPEVLNRINETYIFKNLTKKDIETIINNVLNKIIKDIKSNDIIIELFKDKIKDLTLTKVKNILKKENIELNSIENIRKIESEAETIIIKYVSQ